MFIFEIVFGAIVIMAVTSIVYGIGWAIHKFGFGSTEVDPFIVLLTAIVAVLGTGLILFMMYLTGHECVNLILGKRII